MEVGRTIKIGNHLVGESHPPFIIAEMSGNHNQSLSKALKIVEAVAGTGATALKIQTYKPESLTIDFQNNEFYISDYDSPWKGRSLYDLYREACTPYEWHEAIFEKCKELGLLCFSTPFDFEAVDFLERFEVPVYKIASFENVHYPLIAKVARTGKPIIISSGMASKDEISDFISCARDNGAKDIIVLKCTSSYPASPEDSNLLTIPDMRKSFNIEVGLSDHTLGIGAAVASIALGARVIEKHFTIDRSEGGVDSTFSLEPQEFSNLVVEANRAWQSLGKISYEVGEKEMKSQVYRRSIYVVKDIESGEKFSDQNVRIIRPGLGLHPKYLNSLLGSVANKDYKRGTPLSVNDLHQEQSELR